MIHHDTAALILGWILLCAFFIMACRASDRKPEFCEWCHQERDPKDLMSELDLEGNKVKVCRDAGLCVTAMLAVDGFYKKNPKATQ